jgi:hypothetical protein
VADEQTFEVLLTEFRRVGVDPDTFSAMLAVRPEDALHALRALPNDAGAAAFLRELRRRSNAGATPDTDGGAPSLPRIQRGQRNKSA